MPVARISMDIAATTAARLGTEGDSVVYAVIGAVALLVVWLGVAYARVQWDQWEVLAEQSPRPWVRKALQRKWFRVPLMVLMEAAPFVR